MFQFLIGSMKGKKKGTGSKRLRKFQFLIGSMKDGQHSRRLLVVIRFNSL